MEEKVILLTGASGGLGSELAKLLAKNNKLILQYNSRQIDLPESDKVLHVKADLTEPEQLSSIVSKGLERFGRIDVLINNAGVSESGVSWKTSAESWRRTMQVNLDAPFYLSQTVIPLMRAQKFGRIINISSVVAVTGVVGTSAYAASKAGLLGLTKTLAKELSGFGITAHAIALGYFDRGMISDVPENQLNELKEQVPLKRLGSPKEIFKTIEWLMTEEGGYMSGQTVHLNGGLYV